MPEQVRFINRESELALIAKLVGEGGTLRIVCLYADGGIGKTRLLQEVRDRYRRHPRERLFVTDILDFDDRSLHISENVGVKIARLINQETFDNQEAFDPYLNVIMDYHKMKGAGVRYERLMQTLQEGDQKFIECFHKVAGQKRIVLLFDTTDALRGTDFWEYLVKMGDQLRNTLILVAGRNADKIGAELQSKLPKDVIQHLPLPPLQDEAGEQYLNAKQELLQVTLAPELYQKLLLLAQGKPILLDLAAEWLARNIPLPWLVDMDLQELQALPADARRKRQQEFERQLVLHIAQKRTRIDHLILWLSRIYPLDVKMIATFLDISEQEAEGVVQEAIDYVFIKRLPDGRINLHDEMRRMIKAYVWREIDPKGDRRRRDSEIIIKYLDKTIQALGKEIEQLQQAEKLAEEQHDLETALDSFAKRVAAEQKIWLLKAEHLEHTLFVDLDRGVRVFIEAFGEATRHYQFTTRESLFIQIKGYLEKLSPEQRYKVNSRRVKHLFEMGQYAEATKIATETISNNKIALEQQVNILILRANAEIRLGNIKNSIEDFEEAVKISETNDLSIWLIKSLNGLGWAHRLTGNVKKAKEYYEKASRLCWNEGGPNKKALREHYGWISNNFAFVLSNNYKTRHTAIRIALQAIEHWKRIGNKIGLGAGYLVLGIAYYQNDLSELAIETFQKALDIFKPLEANDWIGQIYSWRGALFHHLQKPDEAKRDLEESLKVGSSNIKAMTRNRLGRVYMFQHQWDKAEKYITEALAQAQEIPDYLYWLASIGRLATIAAAKGEYYRLSEFEASLNNYLQKIQEPDEANLGITYLGLAKLAFGQNDPKQIDKIVRFLQDGITLITESGPYSRADILKRLADVERSFHEIKTEIINAVGQRLQKYFIEQEGKNPDYRVVTPVMNKWATWKGEQKTNG